MSDTVITIGTTSPVYWAICYRFAHDGSVLVRVLGPRPMIGFERDMKVLLGEREQDDTVDGLYWSDKPTLLADVEDHLRDGAPLHSFPTCVGHIPNPNRPVILV